MQRMLLGMGLLLFLWNAPGAAGAQEPVYVFGHPAVRFEQSPGVFHFLYSCETGREMASPAQLASKLSGASEEALCWPGWAVPTSKNATTLDPAAIVRGRIMISAHDFRFLPNEEKNADSYTDFRPQEVEIQHKPGENHGFFGAGDALFAFGFSNLCPSCPASATVAPPTTNPAQLDNEFDQLRDSTKHFDSVKQQVQVLTSRIRVEIRSNNQPGVSDISESLPLYADLNARFAELCQEPAKSCIRAFAAFEKCKSNSWSAECGSRPTCSEACVIGLQDLKKLNADACVQLDQLGASLSPDWTEVARAKKSHQLPIKSFTPGVVKVEMTPGPNPPSAIGCSVNASFERASMADVAFGVAGMEGLGGTPTGMAGQGGTHPKMLAMKEKPGEPGTSGEASASNGVKKKVIISAAVAAGMLVKKVQPAYPPVARAARVQGTVVLQALITKTGEISDLHVIDGPPLLRSAALDAVRQWQYKPFLLNGAPVEVETTINVIFALGESTPAAAAPPSAPAAKSDRP